MTEEEKQKKNNELWRQIVDNTITEEEAIREYMKLGDSRKLARSVYREIRGEVYKALHGLM